MDCPACGTSVPAGARFCSECAEADVTIALAALGHDLTGWDRLFTAAANAGP